MYFPIRTIQTKLLYNKISLGTLPVIRAMCPVCNLLFQQFMIYSPNLRYCYIKDSIPMWIIWRPWVNITQPWMKKSWVLSHWDERVVSVTHDPFIPRWRFAELGVLPPGSRPAGIPQIPACVTRPWALSQCLCAKYLQREQHVFLGDWTQVLCRWHLQVFACFGGDPVKTRPRVCLQTTSQDKQDSY